MEWSHLATYIWLEQAFYALIYPFERDQELLEMIKNGNLAYELIRPQNFFMKFYIKMIAKKTVATLLRSIPVLIFAFILPEPLGISMPNSIIHFIILSICKVANLL